MAWEIHQRFKHGVIWVDRNYRGGPRWAVGGLFDGMAVEPTLGPHQAFTRLADAVAEARRRDAEVEREAEARRRDWGGE